MDNIDNNQVMKKAFAFFSLMGLTCKLKAFFVL